MCPRSTDIHNAIRRNLAGIIAQGRRRARRELQSPQGPVVRLDDREVLNFCSNDYLGFANHPAITLAFRQGVDRFGTGSGASQLVCGYTTAHRLLEEKLAEFTARPRALLFSSGYLANLAIVASLLDRSGVVIGDRLNHASLIDAALLSRATVKRFRHADPAALEEALRKTGDTIKLVMTDGVFSMDGDIAPLNEYAGICENEHAWLAVDDAHGFGVLGEHGGGTLELQGLGVKQVPLLMATFGKALGTSGAFIAGEKEVLEYFVQSARTLIYTTAPPPALAVATVRALELLREEDWRRQALHELINYFRESARQQGLSLAPSRTQIQPLIIGAADKTVALSKRLLEKGIYIQAIRPPTVPEGTSRLRITLTAAHERRHVDQLLETLPTLL